MNFIICKTDGSLVFNSRSIFHTAVSNLYRIGNDNAVYETLLYFGMKFTIKSISRIQYYFEHIMYFCR